MNDIPRMTVEVHSNHVHFYADVDTDRCLALIQELQSLDSQLRSEQVTRRSDGITPIWLHIHTGGGDLLAAFAVADQIKTLGTPVYSIVEGLCASAGTLISMACHKRFITPNAFMLIHQLSSMAFGTHEQLKDTVDGQKKMMEKIIIFYQAHSRLTKKQIKAMVKRETWFNTEEALAAGVVDEVYR